MSMSPALRSRNLLLDTGLHSNTRTSPSINICGLEFSGRDLMLEQDGEFLVGSTSGFWEAEPAPCDAEDCDGGPDETGFGAEVGGRGVEHQWSLQGGILVLGVIFDGQGM
jgi:hypothetical protein